MRQTNNHSNRYYLAWLAISLFYFFQYIIRISPGIMVVELRQEFKIDAEAFSSLGAIYLYAYSLTQVPFGLLLDRYGVKPVLVSSIMTCLVGTFLFTHAVDVWMLQSARFLIGLGSAPAFICALKIVSDRLPSKKQGLFMGATLSIGTIGALLSGKALVMLLDSVGWRTSMTICIGLGAFILVLVYMLIPKNRSDVVKQETFKLQKFVQDLWIVLKTRQVVLYSVIAIGVYTPLCVLADLWGTAFLMEKFQLSRAGAAQITLSMYGGLTLGSFVLPWVSGRYNQLRRYILLSALGIAIAITTILVFDNIPAWGLVIILSSVGFFCGAEMICFTGAASYATNTNSGLLLGVVNTLNMLGGGLANQVIGSYLEYQWKGTYMEDGSKYYGHTELSHAFMILPAFVLLCCLLTIFLPKGIEKKSLNN